MRLLGKTYKERRRTRPILDTFGHNPYPDNAAEPPWVHHPEETTVGQGDLQRLLEGIRAGFSGTAQPLPGEGPATVWYLETGFQTAVPRDKRRFYRGAETDPYVVPPVAHEDAEPWVRDQASQIRDALLLARCQPAVGAFFNFELLDEDRLAGWQSGSSGATARRRRPTTPSSARRSSSARASSTAPPSPGQAARYRRQPHAPTPKASVSPAAPSPAARAPGRGRERRSSGARRPATRRSRRPRRPRARSRGRRARPRRTRTSTRGRRAR